jgi:hypothetical protein
LHTCCKFRIYECNHEDHHVHISNTLEQFVMDFFDATEEFYGSIQDFMRDHEGKCPKRVYVSPTLFQWISQVRIEEAQLKGFDLKKLDLKVFPTEFGTPQVVIDELLSDYDIIAE